MTGPEQPGVPEYGTPEYERWYARHFPTEYAAWRAQSGLPRDGEPIPSQPPKAPRKRQGFVGWLSGHPVKTALTGIGAFLALMVAIGAAAGGGTQNQTTTDNAADVGVATTTSAAAPTTKARPSPSHTPRHTASGKARTTHPTKPTTHPATRSTHRAVPKPTTHPATRSTHRAVPKPTPAVVVRHGLAMPNHALTPGAVFANMTTAQACTPGWSSAHRDVTESERYAVFAAYHIPYTQHASYELDHLIPLELGGSNAESNLWPQTQTENDTNGPDKDALENHLHGLVCSGQLPLTTAEHAIAADWIAAWNTYQSVPVRQRTHTAAPTHPPALTTTAPPTHPPAPTKTAPPPPAQPVQPACHPLTNGGNCYEPGEYCRASDHGATGVAGDGESIKCEDNNGWRWEPI